MGQDGLQEVQGTASRPSVSATSAKTEMPQMAANSLIKTRQHFLYICQCGAGTALTGVWNGAPVSHRGVPTSAAIWKFFLSKFMGYNVVVNIYGCRLVIVLFDGYNIMVRWGVR